MITRELKQTILAKQKPGFINIIYGQRRVGKTVLLRQIEAEFPQSFCLYLNGDTQEGRDLLSTTSQTKLTQLVKNHDLIMIDEAQRVSNIGLSLKILIDSFPKKRYFVTGSSSLSLAQGTKETLTGRTQSYLLYPFSWRELAPAVMPGGERVMLEELLIHGSYPYLQQLAKPSEKEEYLGSLVDDYLFKDVLYLGKLRLPENLKKLAVLLAFQIGSEVSLNELSRTLGIDIKTVQSYLTFLKLSFVIYELPSYSGNLRQEVTKSKKYYFWDLGIRNALINQFSEFQLRPDKGALWENWLVSERLKLLESDNNQKQLFFWRNYAQAEIDWLEITGSKISAYEFKWHGRKAHTPRDFEQAYKTKVNLVSSANFQEFLEK